MAGLYKAIGDRYKLRYGSTVKTCYIADVLASHGLTRRVANNRIDPSKRKYPCPVRIRPMIEAILRDLGRI